MTERQKKPTKTRRAHGFVTFNPDDSEQRYMLPDPLDERNMNIIWALRYAPDSLSKKDLMRAAEICGAYLTIATYELHGPMMSKVRDLRRYVKETTP